MADIFLSYASEDRERVAALVEAFERQGWSVWWDRNIDAGQHFDSVIEEQIQAARCVVVVWTRRSIDADWVRSEALEAMERKILVPVRLDDVRPPMAFRRIQTVDLVGWPERRDPEAYKRLIGGIAAFIMGTLQADPERVLDRPSLAVLPFTNMSSDPEGEFIADGMTEDLITSLSKTFDMFVIARNSSFSYKGRAVDVRQVGGELGVSYVLEGSIRRFKEGALRITAQLTETESGTHVWAEKYDRAADQLFEIQDDLIAQVGSATNAKILEREITRHTVSDRSDIARWRMNRRFETSWTRDFEGTAENFRKSLAEVDAAIESAPENVWLVAWKAEVIGSWSNTVAKPDEKAEMRDAACALAREAAQRAPDDNAVLRTAGFAFSICGRYEEGILLCERAVRRDPHSTWAAAYLGHGLIASAKDPARGVALLDDVLRRDPFIPSRAFWLFYQGIAFARQGDLETAVSKLRESVRLDPLSFFPRLRLAMSLVELHRTDEAQVEIEEVRRLYPELTLDSIVATVRHLSGEKVAAGYARAIGALWKAEP
ncbi:MAG TPA: TIR domain-containing protein [Verrucomicrobiae bacterium]|nr:TIR domain-containing protein [Verrucomicrobiae bacterium]